MLEFLTTALWFLLAISILVAIHEFGHFWVAQKLGVKVLRYSIGMGKPFFIRKFGKDQTEFALSAFPIGGYVAMLNDQEGEVAEADRPRAFNNQPIWKRSLITLAGPLFNFLLAIVIFWGVGVWGVTGTKPVIDQIGVDSVANHAGLKPGMQIVSVEGWNTATWDAVYQESLPRLVEKSSLNLVARDQSGIEHTYTLDLSGLNLDRDLRSPFDALGIYPFEIPPLIDKVIPGKAAAMAGLKSGDRITRLDNQVINHWNQIGRFLFDKAGKRVTIEYVRDGKQYTTQAVPERHVSKGFTIGLLGISPQPPPEKSYAKADYQYSPLEAIGYSLHRTWNISYITVRVLGLMVSMEMSLLNISGPVNIAVVAGKSASIGLEYYIVFLALVSISLGILNLLPVPVLDGGHLVYYAVEAIKGSPVSEHTEAIGQRIGIMMLVMLMMLALYNDIIRLST